MGKFVGHATKIFLSTLILMQMSDDFSSTFPTFRCNALRMINLDAPPMALQGDTIELSCSYSLITPTSSPSSASSSSSSSSPPSPPQDNHQISGLGKQAAHNSDTKFLGDNSIDKLSTESLASSRLSANKLNKKKSPTSNSGSVSTVSNGESAQLELVYAIKWYKDEREFFRFIAQDWPNKQAFPLDGLNIDVDKSNNQTVVLKNVSLKTSGLFRCEVSTDAPSFLTKSIARKVFVYSLPNDGPTIEQPLKRTNQVRYLGDQLNFGCSSRESKPATQIDWIINETLNLSSFASPPLKTNGEPLFKISARRVIRLPILDGLQRKQPPLTMQYQTNDISQADSAIQPQLQKDRSTSLQQQQQKSQTSFAAYELDDSSWPPAAKPLDSPASIAIVLDASSLHQLLETTISWLNLSVDTDLLQYLSSVGALSEWPTNDVMWSTRKLPGAQTSSDPARSNQSSPRGNFLSKKRKNYTLNAGQFAGSSDQKRSSSQQSGHLGASFSVRIRCVARVMHLSLSDDIKLKIVNKTEENSVQELSPVGAQGHNYNRLGKNSASKLLSPVGVVIMSS